MSALGSVAGARKGKKLKKLQTGPTSGLMSMPNPSTITQADLDINNQFYAANAPQSINNPVVTEKQGDWAKQVGVLAPGTGKIIQGIQQLGDEQRALERAEQMRDVSALTRRAASMRPEEIERRYVRPEDAVNTGEEMFPIYGVGTNVLAKNGAEIANTFAPNTLYDDLGYEPLNDSERYKQFFYGGKMQKAASGLEAFASAGGGNMASQLITSIGGENAGGNIGGEVGKLAGTALFGPVGGMVGQAAGQLIGTAINRKPQKTKQANEATQRNIQAMSLGQGMQGGQSQYTSFMKDGGSTSPYAWMSHTWQPQLIASFGEHKLKDLLAPPKDADMLRAGGHLKEYTAPSERAMSTERPMMQMGGELQTHWGGYSVCDCLSMICPCLCYKRQAYEYEQANKEAEERRLKEIEEQRR
jgi:hypothetical protein